MKSSNPCKWQYRHLSKLSWFLIFFLLIAVVWAVIYFDISMGSEKKQMIASVISIILILSSAIINLVSSISIQGMKIDIDARTVVMAKERKKVIDGKKLRSVIRRINAKGQLKEITLWFEGYGYYDIPMNDDEYSDFIGKARLLSSDFTVKEYAD